jgi:hypothetical protein
MSTIGAYNMLTKSLLKIVAMLQEVNPFVQGQEWCYKDFAAMWTINTNGILCYNKKVYILNSTAV